MKIPAERPDSSHPPTPTPRRKLEIRSIAVLYFRMKAAMIAPFCLLPVSSLEQKRAAEIVTSRLPHGDGLEHLQLTRPHLVPDGDRIVDEIPNRFGQGEFL